MKSWTIRIFISAMLATGGLILSGCESKDPSVSTQPWVRPASWEGTAPGMGGQSLGGNPGSGRGL